MVKFTEMSDMYVYCEECPIRNLCEIKDQVRAARRDSTDCPLIKVIFNETLAIDG